MNTALVWGNVVAYSLQIGLLVGLASVVPGLLRLQLPKARLMYWHLLLTACLLLPQTRPWKQAIVTVRVPAMVPEMPPPSTPMTQVTRPWSPGEIGLLLLAAGALGRFGWLAVGFWKLRRYRKHSTPWRGPSVQFGVRPEYRVSEDITSPVTFGLLNPVVLLPRTFLDLAPAMQDAILCHEALHVERRDWAFTVAEEVVRAVFWFHPAIWWLLGEIQLAREQAVDREVVERTQARDEYVDALLAAAGAKMELDLAPAPLFLRKRHLRQRVATIFTEVGMSKARLISTFTAGLAVLTAACWFVTAAFPLAASPQVVADAPGVAVELNGAQLMHRTRVAYPAPAMEKKIQGTVVAQVKLAANGDVVDASIVSGPDELRKAVLESILTWHFQKDYAGSTRQVTVNFQLPEPAAIPPATALSMAPALAVSRDTALSVVTPSPAVVKGILVSGLSDSVRGELLAALPVREGDTATPEVMWKAIQAVRAFDEHLRVGQIRSKDGSVSLTITAPGASVGPMNFATTPMPPSAPLAPRADAPPVPGRIQVGGNIQAAMLVSGDKPAYPALAKQARISGVVQLHAFIGKDGAVQSLSVIPPAHPLLAPAAMEAVRSWRYKPTLLNGEPVEVETTIDVSFMLSDENN